MRRLDDLPHIHALCEIRVQRVNVVHADVAGGVLGDMPVRAEPEMDLDVLADGDAVVAVAEIVRFEAELVEEVQRSRNIQRGEHGHGPVEHGGSIRHRSSPSFPPAASAYPTWMELWRRCVPRYGPFDRLGAGPSGLLGMRGIFWPPKTHPSP